MGSILLAFALTHRRIASTSQVSKPSLYRQTWNWKESLDHLAASELNMHDFGQLENVSKARVRVEPATILL